MSDHHKGCISIWSALALRRALSREKGGRLWPCPAASMPGMVVLDQSDIGLDWPGGEGRSLPSASMRTPRSTPPDGVYGSRSMPGIIRTRWVKMRGAGGEPVPGARIGHERSRCCG